MKIYVILLLCFFFTTCCCGKPKVYRNPMTVANPVFTVQVPVVQSPLKSETRVLIEHLPDLFYHNQSYHSISDACVDSIGRLVDDLFRGEHYPLIVLDSWGKPESGILFANLKWLGSYSECMDVQSLVFRAKFCVITFGQLNYKNALVFDEKAPLQIGACVPDACPAENLTEIFDQFDKNITVSCPEDNREWNAVDIFALILCLMLVLLAISATVIDYAVKKSGRNYLLLDDKNISSAYSVTAEDNLSVAMANKHGGLRKIASAFSIFSNFKKIFETEQKQENINCIHGMRFISITWVVLGHSFLLMINFSDNMVAMLGFIVNHWEFQAVVNGTYSVDTFFFISGLLVSFLSYRNLVKTGGKMNVLKLYFSRYLRLTPLYGFVILIFVSLYLKTIAGPIWSEVIGNTVETCKQKWFTNLLYINNIYPANLIDECYAIGWYLSNDFQFFLLSPLFVFLLYRNRKIGIAVTSVVILASITITGAFSSYTQQPTQVEMFGNIAKYGYSQALGLPANISLNLPDPNQNFYLSDIYAKPWCRISVYLIGMLTGYFLCIKNRQLKINKVVVTLGWLVSAVVCCCIVYCLYPSAASGYQLNNNVAAFYNAVSRPLWSICMAWVTIACTCGYGGPVNSFLSWKGFIPLSRLTYAIYLVHPLVIWWYLGSNDRLFHFNLQSYILLFLGSLVLTTGVALVCALLVEYPFIALTKSAVGLSEPKPVVLENPVPVEDDDDD